MAGNTGEDAKGPFMRDEKWYPNGDDCQAPQTAVQYTFAELRLLSSVAALWDSDEFGLGLVNSRSLVARFSGV